jgi:hypothetical protein
VNPVRLNIRSVNWQSQDGAVSAAGPYLSKLLLGAAERGVCPPVAVTVRGGRAELIGLEWLKKAKLTVPYFLASLSRSETAQGQADAVGLMGIFNTIASTLDVPVAIVFLEWGDCRWWYWRALVDPETGVIRADTITISCAEDGDPMPKKIGRWWSYGRRIKVRVGLKRLLTEEQDWEESGEARPEDLVH